MIKKIYLLKIYIRERTGLKYLNDSKAFLNIQMMWMIFVKTLKVIIQIKNEKYWSCLEVWLLICLVNKKLYPIVTELFIRGRRLNLFLVFIIQSYSAVPKNIRLKTLRTILLWKIQTNKNVKNFYPITHQILTLKTLCTFIICTAKAYSFLVTDATLASDNPFTFQKESFRKNIKINQDN